MHMIGDYNKIIINNAFLFVVATEIIRDDYDPQIVNNIDRCMIGFNRKKQFKQN